MFNEMHIPHHDSNIYFLKYFWDKGVILAYLVFQQYIAKKLLK